MALEGIATLPMQDMPAPQESQGIGAFNPSSQEVPEIGERERFDAVMTALERQNPEMVAKMNQILDEANLTPEQIDALDQLIQVIERDPSKYKQIIQEMAKEGLDPTDFPPEYDQEFMTLLKMVVYGYQQREDQRASEPVPFARGGIAEAARHLASQGRGQDTILAHINPAEARLLRKRGGMGTINPNTGLPEFGFFSGITKAIGGAVKAVVGTVSKVLGPQVTSLVATIGGFMIGGPAGAALAQGLVTYGQGGSLKDALLNSATAYIGSAFGPVAGAAAGAGSTLLKGGSLKDAIKAAAISGAMSYGMSQMGQLGSQGMAPEGTDLSRMGSLDANNNFVPEGVSTPGSVSASGITEAGGSISSPSSVSGINPTGGAAGYGLNAGPAPTTTAGLGASSGYGNLNLPSYDIGTSSVAVPSSGISALGNAASPTAAAPTGFMDRAAQFYNNPSLSSFGEMIMPSDATPAQLQNSDAFKAARASGASYTEAMNAAKSSLNPGMMAKYGPTVALGLGATALAGGFKAKPATPPGLTNPNITGETLIKQDPNKYIVQGMPGVRYNPQGGIDYTGTGNVYQPNFEPTRTVTTPTYGLSNNVSPVYQPPGTSATQMPTGVQQPFNVASMYDFMNYNPYAPQRQYAMGGPVMQAPEFMPGSSVAMYRQGGISQFPRKMGHISGPGTGTSDDIPAMLSDGEFVITAKAVKGIGNGSRREGAKKLYRMMHAMEKKAGGSI